MTIASADNIADDAAAAAVPIVLRLLNVAAAST